MFSRQPDIHYWTSQTTCASVAGKLNSTVVKATESAPKSGLSSASERSFVHCTFLSAAFILGMMKGGNMTMAYPFVIWDIGISIYVLHLLLKFD